MLATDLELGNLQNAFFPEGFKNKKMFNFHLDHRSQLFINHMFSIFQLYEYTVYTE